jgi:WS/DGAT C-terminal domain
VEPHPQLGPWRRGPALIRGARTEEGHRSASGSWRILPASIVTDGQALNITCESYAGQMSFGFTGCHTSVPSPQKLAVYSAEALEELETTLLPKAKARGPAAKANVKTSGAAAKAREAKIVSG